ncbi:MAG: demethoxyubiquinone hydroxylase family protein [Alphaproteobacteria bacterium CG11_big_fil_rev_8_21_14_0_20_44_7]|nr:MAG: demethoxyubiquinone hydroxylase family protein [Alphaproteobacteria bacterium CG11_big_fil_rev_8_21_14_0_20_44_7]
MKKPNPNPEPLEQMLRVDHAGEYGANRIYEGQLKILGKSKLAPELKHMLEQEREHLKKFDELLVEHKARPSALMPLWHIGGIALGVGSALLGEKAAMACTVAVEEAIDEHYQEQEEALPEGDLKEIVKKFRAEELEHRDKGLEHHAEEMPGYEVFTGIIKGGCKAAIWLAKRF